MVADKGQKACFFRVSSETEHLILKAYTPLSLHLRRSRVCGNLQSKSPVYHQTLVIFPSQSQGNQIVENLYLQSLCVCLKIEEDNLKNLTVTLSPRKESKGLSLKALRSLTFPVLRGRQAENGDNLEALVSICKEKEKGRTWWGVFFSTLPSQSIVWWVFLGYGEGDLRMSSCDLSLPDLGWEWSVFTCGPES